MHRTMHIISDIHRTCDFLLKGFVMVSNFVSIKDLNLSGAIVVGVDYCSVEIQGSDLVCVDVFGRPVIKFPVDFNCKYRCYAGLPAGVFFDENGDIVLFEVDFDDEDYDPDSEPEDCGFFHVSTSNFTLIIRGEQ